MWLDRDFAVSGCRMENWKGIESSNDLCTFWSPSLSDCWYVWCWREAPQELNGWWRKKLQESFAHLSPYTKGVFSFWFHLLRWTSDGYPLETRKPCEDSDWLWSWSKRNLQETFRFSSLSSVSDRIECWWSCRRLDERCLGFDDTLRMSSYGESITSSYNF